MKTVRKPAGPIPLAGLALASVLALSCPSAHSADLLAYWDFNDDANPGKELSGNAPDLTLSASAMLTPDGDGVTGDPGDRGLDTGAHADQGWARTTAGPHFDQIPNDNAYTIVFWQFNRQIANTSAFWMHAPTSDGNQRGIQAHTPWGNGTIFFDQSGCCDPPERLTVGGQIQLNTWQHLAFRRDAAGNRSIWVDGTSVATAGGADPLDPFDGILTIGAEGPNGNNSFNGIIDEFAVFAGDLTDQEIMDLASGGSPADLLVDTDGDGMTDSYEDNNGLDKNVDDSAGDLDNDGLTNLEEFQGGTDPQDDDSDDDGLLDGVETKTGTYVDANDTGTDPRNADSDNDGLSDGVENNSGTFNSETDTGTDPNEADTDGDSWTDGFEVSQNTDPNDPAEFPDGVVLPFTDDFEDGVLNPLAWTTALSIPQGGASVTEESGHVTLRQRGHLVTFNEYDPTQIGPLIITGEWTWSSLGGVDFFQVLTRSDGVPDPGNCCGETRSGVEFRIQSDQTAVGIGTRGGFQVGNLQQTGSLNISQGMTTVFEIIDFGNGDLSFRLEEKGNPANASSATAEITSDPTDTNFIVFHNREAGDESLTWRRSPSQSSRTATGTASSISGKPKTTWTPTMTGRWTSTMAPTATPTPTAPATWKSSRTGPIRRTPTPTAILSPTATRWPTAPIRPTRTLTETGWTTARKARSAPTRPAGTPTATDFRTALEVERGSDPLNPASVPPLGPAWLYYDFEEGSGNQLIDKSGNEFHGDIVNNVTFTDGAPDGPTPTFGGRFSVGGAGHVNIPGIDVPSMLAHRNSNPDGSYTFVCWMKPEAESIGGDHFFWGQQNQGIHNGLRGGGTLHTAHWGSDFNGNTVLTAGEWIHAAWTYDGPTNTAFLYLNGSTGRRSLRSAGAQWLRPPDSRRT